MLGIGVLVVEEREFKRWYRLERSKGKWPSQRSKLKRGRGRPTKQTAPLKKSVLALVRDHAWNARDGIGRLRRLLIAHGHLESVPSPDTLVRFVDELHLETGDPLLLRR
jgi:hypothetical protein